MRRRSYQTRQKRVNATPFRPRSAKVPGEVLRQARASVLALTFSASLLTARPAPCAEPSAVDRPPPAHAVASDRRRIFVGVVGFLALVLGSVGFYLVRRQRKNEAPPALPPPQPSPAPDVATVQEAAPSGMVMVCPTCRRQPRTELLPPA